MAFIEKFRELISLNNKLLTVYSFDIVVFQLMYNRWSLTTMQFDFLKFFSV